MNKILVTGAAGFIGSHLCKRLIKENYSVIGLDNLNHYYDVKLKLSRLENLGLDTYELAMGKSVLFNKDNSFTFYKADLSNLTEVQKIIAKNDIEIVVNLAAQAGVRYSIENPSTYVECNIVGFNNLLESCRKNKIKHLIYASSSSVYGNSKSVPFNVNDRVDRPISVYAATKASNELMAHVYNHLFNMEITGLRFFTVYGPWGRPDMAYFLFTKSILENSPIKVFNNGHLSRDFTFIDDIIDGLMLVIGRSRNDKSHKLYNIGNNSPVSLLDFISTIESHLGKKAQKNNYPMQDGDVETTYADISSFMNDYGYAPKTDIKDGLKSFVEWYINYNSK